MRPSLIEMQEDALLQDAVLAALHTSMDGAMPLHVVVRRTRQVSGRKFLSETVVRWCVEKLVRRGVVVQDQVKVNRRWALVWWRTT